LWYYSNYKLKDKGKKQKYLLNVDTPLNLVYALHENNKISSLEPCTISKNQAQGSD